MHGRNVVAATYVATPHSGEINTGVKKQKANLRVFGLKAIGTCIIR